MTNYAFQLDSPCIHLIESSESEFCNFTWKIQELAPAFIVKSFRGKKMQDLPAFFNEFAAVLQFPYYFGENWSALDECINDMEWMKGQGYVLCFRNSSEILNVLNTENDFFSFVRILRNASNEWAEKNNCESAIPFHIVFHAQIGMLHIIKNRLDHFNSHDTDAQVKYDFIKVEED